MAKKRKSPPVREVTKRRLARWQREKRRRRILVSFAAVVIAVVIGIISYGAYHYWVAVPGEVLSTVHGTTETVKFTRADYRDMLRLSPDVPAETPLLMLEQHELMRQGAEELGIGVTEDDITEHIKSLLFPEDDEVSEEEFQARYQQTVEDSGMSEEWFRWFIEYQLLHTRLGEYFSGQVPEVALQVHALGILVATEGEGETVIERLEAGEGFATLAQELSLDETSKEAGGDLGWVPEGIRGEAFDDIAFDLELGAVGETFSTAEGCWVIKLLEKEEREIADDAGQQLAVNAFNDWLEAEKEQKVVRKSGLDLDKIYEWAMK